MSEKDKASLYIILLVFTFIMSIGAFYANTYDRVQLRAFNKLNATSYTLDQWHVYEYEIKELYPFKGQGRTAP